MHLVDTLWILSKKFCFIFIPGPGCPDPEWFFLIRLRIRIRIQQKVSDLTGSGSPKLDNLKNIFKLLFACSTTTNGILIICNLLAHFCIGIIDKIGWKFHTFCLPSVNWCGSGSAIFFRGGCGFRCGPGYQNDADPATDADPDQIH